MVLVLCPPMNRHFDLFVLLAMNTLAPILHVNTIYSASINILPGYYTASLEAL